MCYRSIKVRNEQPSGGPIEPLVYDHVGGTEKFKGAKVICHVSCQKFFDIDVQDITPKKIDITFKGDLSIDLGNRSVELYHWEAGDGVATTQIIAGNVANISDLYEGPRAITIKLWMDDKNLVGVRNILNKLVDMKLDHVIDGHNIETDSKIFHEHAQFNNDLFDAVLCWQRALEKLDVHHSRLFKQLVSNS